METKAVIDLGWQPPTLTTARLVIRPFTPADADSLYKSASNPNVTRYTLWSYHRGLEDSRNFILSYARSQYMQEVPEPLAICPIENLSKIYGAVGCFWVAREHQSMELGYWIAEEHWGHGYASEAARALVSHVFATFAVNRMQAHCVVDNDSSSKVIERLGFQFEGVARSAVCLRGTFHDVKRYAVLKDEWRA